ncbi:beta strand repeat-containing protein [Campylobacter concisus]|nr:hypothetical protein [Campylobacter concisus]
MTYDLSLPTALTARPTTLNLNFSGGVAGVDYDANSIEYSTDGGNNWTRGTIVNLADANQINNVKVRVTTIDNYGHDGVDIATNPTAQSANQNQGEQDGSRYSNLNGVEYGVYKRNLTLNVTTDNDEIINSQANGKITDNDDYVNINEGLSEAVFTGDGDDTVNMSGAFSDVNSYVSTEDGNDVINVKSGSVLNYGNAQIDAGDGNDTINLNQGSFVGMSGSFRTRIYGGDGDDTFNMDGEIGGGIVHGDDGNDTFNVGSTGVLKDGATIYANEGNDTINFGGTAENGAQIQGNEGYDTINIKSGAVVDNSYIYGDSENEDSISDEGNEINIDGTVRNNSNVYGGAGVDTVNINGTVENSSMINTLSGDDIVNINAGAEISEGSYIYTGDDNDIVNVDGTVKHSTIDTQAGTGTIKVKGSIEGGTEIGTHDGSIDMTVEDGGKILNSQVYGDNSVDKFHAKEGSTLSGAFINLKDGNDEATIDTDMTDGSKLMTGDGDDIVTFKKGINITDSVIDTGSGSENITLDGITSDSSKFLFTGTKYYADDTDNDNITIKNSTFSNDLEKDRAERENRSNAVRDSEIALGGGTDKLDIVDTQMRDIKIQGNDGHKTITVSGNSMLKDSEIRTESSESDVTIKNGAKLDGTEILIANADGKDANYNISYATVNKGKYEGSLYGSDNVNIIGKKDANGLNDASKKSIVSDHDIDMGGGTNSITIENADVTRGTISGGSDVDNINIKNGATLNGTRIFTGDGIDNITIQGTVKGYANIFTGDGNDIVKVKQGGLVKDSFIQTQGGKDQIDIENGGKLEKSKITVGEGAVVTVQGTLDNSTIDAGNSTGSLEVKILNGADINVESYSYGVSKIIGGKNNDTVTMEGGTIAKGNIKLGKGDDIVKITGGEIKDNSAIEGGEGKDTITISENATMIGGKLNTGAGLDDKILVKDGGKLHDTEIILGANGQNGGQSTDRALFEVTGSSKLKDVQINASESSGEQRINFYNDVVAEVKSLTGSNQKDVIDINGKVKFNSEIQTRDGDDELILQNKAVLENGLKVNMGGGVDTVNINAGATINNISINTGADKDTVNINANITADVGKQSNITTEGGMDTVNIASGVTLTRTVIDMGAGEDTIEVRGNSATDRITFKGSTLYTDDAGHTANDIDHVTITNTTFMKSDDGRLSSVQTGGGDDEITVKDGTVFQDISYIQAGDGEDKIYLNSGSTFNYSKVFGGNGGDEIHVNGAEFNGKYGHGGVDGEAGDDKIFVNSGTFKDANIEGGAGNDFISIKQGVSLTNTKIDGGAGYDTLKIADDSVNLTKVTNIEKLDLTQGNHNINLSAKDVLDMTDSNNRLRIDGDSGDNLGLASKGWVEDTSANITGYKVYTNTEGAHTVTLEVQDQVHVF